MRAILRPAPGLLVPNPATGARLAESGESVLLDSYWRRRLSAGDVERVEDPKPTPAKRAPRASERTEE